MMTEIECTPREQMKTTAALSDDDIVRAHVPRRSLLTSHFSLLAVAFGVALSAPLIARAQSPAPVPSRDFGIDQKLDAQVPLDVELRDETGQPVKLGSLFRGKPVILMLVYFKCPMLCTLSLNGLVRNLKPLSFSIGKEFDIITVSFDPREGPELAAAKKTNYLKQYDRPEAAAGWHFLVGDEANIRRLTQAVGFRYAFDPVTEQYAHASAAIVLTPAGRVSKYFLDIEDSTNDLRLGLMEASAGKIGSPTDKLLLFCYHYDPSTGKYGLAIMNILRMLGTITVLAMATFIFIWLRRDRRKKLALAGRMPA